jgi:hypothetical protein
MFHPEKESEISIKTSQSDCVPGLFFERKREYCDYLQIGRRQHFGTKFVLDVTHTPLLVDRHAECEFVHSSALNLN